MTLLLRYPREIGLVALLFAAGFFGMLWSGERDGRIRAEGETAAAVASIAPAVATADSARAVAARYDSVATVALADNARLRAVNLEIQRQAGEERREAEARVVATGATLDASLDSLAADPLLGAWAGRLREQVGAERRARIAEREATDRQLFAVGQLVAVADSSAALWRSRYEAQVLVCDACRLALDRAQAAVASRIEVRRAWHDSGWVKLAGVGLAGWASFEIGRRW